MIRKKHLTLNSNLNKTKENRSTKVTVQYIQEQQQLIQKSDNTIREEQDDLEIENVEYLEETPNVEEYIEEPSEKNDLEDNFYPNAIHCLLDLYKTKYEEFNPKNDSVKVSQIWRDIAKDMQESFFEFNEHQIQQKYVRLREQYFKVQSKEDVEHFDYFEQLHAIYKDPGKENILKGLNASNEVAVYYKDEILLQLEQLDSNENHQLHDFKSEEIVHKEHEFIDMVEKELQAMEEGLHVEDTKDIIQGGKTSIKVITDTKSNKEALMSSEKQQPQAIKRILSDTEPCLEEPATRKQKSNDYYEPLTNGPKTKNDFTLYHYNQQQERRHREKMSLLEKSLQLQERALEQQNQLLQELIKRLPL
ncbi:hypothetical protein FF38_10264 [Lucilia cuprina]|uniref:Myb/SANT-like DNA-binding domain-containing protein n=1 Tax=Lucilia cuprina TaxID=7375 RepID=A0A0L0BZ18_LUCCU|nr:hypothetical protein CVS40_7687 [Lucilia cuprina]KNC25246.1 hypothetical protein FF38_10264 [Lucilia cuprina]